MRTGLAVPATLIAVGLLAACSPRSSTGGGAASPPAAGQSSVPAAPAAAAAVTANGAPRRRDGYWEMASYSAGGSPMSKQFYCVGAGSEDKYSLFDALASVGDCAERRFTRTGSGWSFDTKCKVMDTVTQQTGTIGGDFQQSFIVEQTVRQTGGVEIKGSIRGTWRGDCPAKLRPGDLADSGGDKLGNLLGG
jgi:hypothetical protein